MRHTNQPSGALVVRAWIEGTPAGLRARVTRIDDPTAERVETTAATADEIIAAVRDWLDGLLQPAAAEPPAGADCHSHRSG